ncbi:MAG: hypothetical protein ABIG68_10100 [Acidobacteriota bacterium]
MLGNRRLAMFSTLFGVICAMAPPGSATAQEKPPEVVRLDQLPSETTRFVELQKQLETEIEIVQPRIIEMNDWLYRHPESGYEEVRAADMLASELKQSGFEVAFGVSGIDAGFNAFVDQRFGGGGLKTAFVAKHKGRAQHPVICFMLEADALRSEQGPFHGCQHNQQGPAAIGSAIALSRLVERHELPGSVWVIHCPAEEISPSTKAAMTMAGVFDEVDFLIRSHGTPHQAKRSRAGLGNCCMLIESTLYTFTGRPSHGSRAWQGRDALDAARLFFTAVDMLREHSEPTFRFMGTISKVGKSPNVTNDVVEVDHWIRNSDRSGLQPIREKQEQVDTIARAAAMATFTEVQINHYGSDGNGIESGWLQALAWMYTRRYGDAAALSEEPDEPTGWDESGIGAVNVPGVSIRPAVADIREVAGHSYENAAVTISPQGHKGLVQTVQIGASVALRLLLDPDLQRRVKDEFAEWQRYGLRQGMITEGMIRRKPAAPER